MLIEVLIEIFVSCVLLSGSAVAEEYCFSEVFQPRCLQDEILLIDQALYGRKKLGRCLIDEVDPSEANLSDEKFIGCYSDVADIIEPQCSGKRQCDVSVAHIQAKSTCYKYLKLYLDITYSCVKVIQENQHCGVSLSTETQHIFISHIPSKSCGQKTRPWSIESLAGQKISVSVAHFKGNVLSEKVSDAVSEQIYFSKMIQRRSECRRFGLIVDKLDKTKQVDICLGKPKNGYDLANYVSESNGIELILGSFEEGHSLTGLLLRLEATGCSDLIPPADAWLKRTENEAIIGCYSTRLRWQLKCQGQQWVGVIGNCSYAHNNHFYNEEPAVDAKIKDHDNQMVTIFAIVMIGLVLCLMITCLGLVCLKRHYALSKSKGLKQMPVYNNGSIGPLADKTLIGHKEFNSGICDEAYLQQNNAQYFELDQTFVKKEDSIL